MQPFHNPTDFGTFDITTSQVNKDLVFSWDTPVLAACKIVSSFRGTVIQTYTVGEGITLSNGNQTATLTISGTDFENKVGQLIDFDCSFFVVGDTEATFKVKVIKSLL